ncbi:MAG: tetratricopeptide repeat protein [Paracoccaceae bacterium]|jgi:Flp pilus assembly protein TadD|nr:tetratricopeptide repeat protein [Paracoccaceae bacterium]MDP7185895.1 tetratricopeptide repeat protein [Paracoccaceae bacterium]
MRSPFVISALLGSALVLSACEEGLQLGVDPVAEALEAVKGADGDNLNEIMMTVAEPSEAVTYFQRVLAQDPENIDLKRGLAISLVRSDRSAEAVTVWSDVTRHPDSVTADLVNLADALVRADQWDAAREVMNRIPEEEGSYQRYRLAAMIADAGEEWEKADEYYETASGLTMKPAAILNNWGYSNLIRGKFLDAEMLFQEAIRQNGKLFTAKNNLMMARGAQRKYDLPVMPMTQTERAELLYTLALTAIKNGDVQIGTGLLREAVDSHPQYFEAAVRSLNALENNVTN